MAAGIVELGAEGATVAGDGVRQRGVVEVEEHGLGVCAPLPELAARGRTVDNSNGGDEGAYVGRSAAHCSDLS
ncbi:hypothetical protein HYQ46_006675 [Verticillium longisporum]|nr:hypothetical protein HYQ46_006675 [Verticillium longisporum]